jgi:hypothetical protein
MNDYSTTAATTDGGSPITMLIWLALIVLMVVSLWKIFVKAGRPGWAAIIPIYQTYIQLKIVNRPGWWLLLMFIPFVNIVILIITSIDLAKAFGKSTAFGVLALAFFPFIGYPMLAFGDAQYQAPTDATPAPASAPTTPPAPTTQV